MSFSGITNINEFFTNYYFSEVFPSELKDHLTAITGEAAESALTELRKSWLRDYASFNLNSSDPEDRAALAATLSARVLSALGYSPAPQVLPAENLEEGITTWASLPAAQPLAAMHIFVIPFTPDFNPDEDDLLNLALIPGHETTWADYLANTLFPGAHAPRWVLLAYPSQSILLDRSRFAAQRYLRFDWPTIFAAHDTKSYRAALTLLHPTALIPTAARPLHDSLEENSHKNAAAASENLKYAVREAIELLGNEVIFFRRQQKLNIYDEIKPEVLSRECLRWLYRLLFLFYVESRKESLQLLAQQGDDFHLAYTLEGLRPLAEIELHSEDSRNGYYLDESLHRLFELIYNGFESNLNTPVGEHSLRRPALPAKLFDLEETPILTRTRLRNSTLQQILKLLSLDSPKGSRRKHRISYHTLGINQLGSVYEGLLSYTGQFAKEDLYEVRPAPGKSKPSAADSDDTDTEDAPQATAEDDPLAQVWFVNKTALSQYRPAEIVSKNGRPVVHPQGTFLYRLASRNRQRSASYYTPEILTSCLVKYTLKPLLEGKSADEILDLTICEPALGSGAFLNEAINQLTDVYLERKHQEIGGKLPDQEDRQKVKAFLADNRVFGVDLNPIAIELAEISLWLNSLYPEHTIPFFGGQLFAGNSLVGTRRQVFTRTQLTDENRGWQTAVPDRVPLGEPLPQGAAWHFLLPNEGMAKYSSKVIKSLYPADTKRLAAWSKDFNRRLTTEDQRSLERLSAAVDRLWNAHAASLHQLRESIANVFPIYGRDFAARNQKRPVEVREKILREGLSGNSPYQRLKLALDYWCALWFWPIDKSRDLPSRDEYWADLLCILEGHGPEVHPLRPEQAGLSFDPLFKQPSQRSLEAAFDSGLGEVDLNELLEKSSRLQLITGIARRRGFLHWELEFADIFRSRNGFDITLGNPPWIRLEFSETDIIGDFDPLPVIRGTSAPEIARSRGSLIDANPGLSDAYRDELVAMTGLQNFLSSVQIYPLLQGTAANTYKCFITNSWYYASSEALQGFVHPEGVYDDPNGGLLRRSMYPRLRFHFQFRNEFALFEGTNDHGRMVFGLSVYGASRDPLGFCQISNLFHPSTIDSSLATGVSSTACGGIKTDANKWNVVGHPDRVIDITETELALFARLYDPPGTSPRAARLPALHSRTLLSVLDKLASYPHKLSQVADRCLPVSHWWNEKTAVDSRSIRRETTFPSEPSQWILSGPHIFVSNPYFKTPKSRSIKSADYDLVDLTALSEDYLPRTNFVPDCDPETYLARTPTVPWGAKRPVTSFYRFACRRQLSQSGERTLLASLIPPGPAHIDSVFTAAFEDSSEMLRLLTFSVTIPADFFVKTTGLSDLRVDASSNLPLMKPGSHDSNARTLLLNCLTRYYAPLWRDSFDEAFTGQRWAKRDHRLCTESFSDLTPEWTPRIPLRSSFSRRQALLELDVLAAQALGLSLDELIAIYRIQFPVFRAYERNTFYDQAGRIVYLDGDQSYGFSTAEWKQIRHMTAGAKTKTVLDNTRPSGPVERTIEYHAPFDCMDREADYAEAWAFFEGQRK